MSLAKTAEGKQALQKRDASLSAKDRQLLILCDGLRTENTLLELMGASALDDIQRLTTLGYLKHPNPAEKHNTSQTLSISKESAAPFERPMSKSRRSLAGTKMYMMDMLQLMRDMDASAMAVALHSCDGEQEFIAQIMSATRLIASKSGTSYGMRVLEKLREIIPEQHLSGLEILAGEIATDPIGV